MPRDDAGAARRRRDEQERELHAAVAQLLRWILRPPTFWTTFPAGGGGLEHGRMMARLGLRAGFPDIIVFHPSLLGHHTIVVGLELKTEIGRQSGAQRDVERDFTATGAIYALCRSIDDVQAVLRSAGVPFLGTR
jgi:hypothetical protein